MNVLHINVNYIGTALHQCMIQTLDRHPNIQSTVFVPTYRNSPRVIVPNDHVCVCECFRKWDRVCFDYKQRKILKGLLSNFDVSEFDLIHAYTLFTDGNCARNLSKKYGIPYVVAIRDTDVNDFYRLRPHLRSRGLRIMQDASAVFFLSEAYRTQVFEKYIPQDCREDIRKKTYIIPNGIDSFWLTHTPEGKESRKPTRLIYAGRISKRKNIPTTQKAMEILRSQGRDLSLTVVGKVEDQKLFEKIQKDPYTRFLPAMPKEQLIEQYRAADLFVMPSFTETFGLVYAEAMSQGLPVVYSKGQGFDGQFPEGEVGFAVDSHSPESVAEGIRKVLERYDEIAPRVAERSKAFHWEDIVSRYVSIYTQILGQEEGSGK